MQIECKVYREKGKKLTDLRDAVGFIAFKASGPIDAAQLAALYAAWVDDADAGVVAMRRAAVERYCTQNNVKLVKKPKKAKV